MYSEVFVVDLMSSRSPNIILREHYCVARNIWSRCCRVVPTSVTNVCDTCAKIHVEPFARKNFNATRTFVKVSHCKQLRVVSLDLKVRSFRFFAYRVSLVIDLSITIWRARGNVRCSSSDCVNGPRQEVFGPPLTMLPTKPNVSTPTDRTVIGTWKGRVRLSFSPLISSTGILYMQYCMSATAYRYTARLTVLGADNRNIIRAKISDCW